MEKTLLVLLLLTVASFAYEEQGNILVLHDADFPKVIEQFDFIMIEFYAPWCGHCKKLQPTYKELADELKEQGSQIRIAKVDSTVDSKCAKTYKVQGYPTILFFHKGEQIDYKGQRSKQYMLNWLLKKTRDPLVPIDQAAYEALTVDNKVNIIFHGDATSEQGLIVSKLATADDYNTYYVVSGIEGKPDGSLELFRPFASAAFYEKADQNLEAWLRRNERPTVVPFDDRTIGDMFSGAKPGVCLFDLTQDSELLNTFTAAANKYLDSGKQLIFTHIQDESEHYGPFSQYIKVDPKSMAVVLIQGKLQSKFVMIRQPSQITEEIITEFLESWNNGQAQKYGITDPVEVAGIAEQEDQL